MEIGSAFSKRRRTRFKDGEGNVQKENAPHAPPMGECDACTLSNAKLRFHSIARERFWAFEACTTDLDDAARGCTVGQRDRPKHATEVESRLRQPPASGSHGIRRRGGDCPCWFGRR